MYKIVMEYYRDGRHHSVDMPLDNNLGLFEAVEHCDIYKKRDTSKSFLVINKDNGDLEYFT